MTRRRNPEPDITLADLAGHVAALEVKLDETLMVHTLTVDMLPALKPAVNVRAALSAALAPITRLPARVLAELPKDGSVTFREGRP